MDGDDFELTEPTGSDNIRDSLANIIVVDETGSSAEETFTTALDLVTRLKELNYPFFFDVSPSKRTERIVFVVSGGSSGSTIWQSLSSISANLNNYTYSPNNANLTPDNDFSDHTIQGITQVVSFKCKIKSATFRGWTNASGSPEIDLVVFKSEWKTPFGNTVLNPKIIARKTIGLKTPNVNGALSEFEDDELFSDIIIDKSNELRIVFNNNNVAASIFSATLVLEFEEIF